MSIYKANTKIGNIYKGTTKIGKIYKGSSLIYSAGYWLTKTGYPCTLTYSLGKALKDYKIYGNSEQLGKNLLDFFNINAQESLDQFGVSAGKKGYILHNLEVGKTYTLSYSFKEEQFCSYLYFYDYYNGTKTITYLTTTMIENNPYIFTVQGGHTYFFQRGSSYTINQDILDKFETFQLEEGSVVTDYVPYNPTPTIPIDVVSLGENRNILNNDVNDIANWETINATSRDFKLDLKAGVTYTISYDAIKVNNTYGYLYFNKSNDNFVTNEIIKLTQNATIINPTLTFVAEAGYEYRLWFYNNPVTVFNDIYSNIQLNTQYIDINLSGKNLFNSSYLHQKSNYTVLSGNGYAGAKLELKPNTSYILKPYRTDAVNPESGFFYKIKNTSTSFSSAPNIGSYLISASRYVYAQTSVTTDSDGYIWFYASANADNEVLDMIFEYYYFQLEEGTVATEYETYQTPVTTTIDMTPSKNLFNDDLLLDNPLFTKTDDGYFTTGYPAQFSVSSKVLQNLKSILKPNVTYTLSRVYSGTTGGVAGRVRIGSGSTPYVTCAYGAGLKSITFSLTQDQINNMDYMFFFVDSDRVGGTFSNIQIEEGSTVTDYVPFKCSGNPLIKVRDVSDYIDYENSRIVRNIGKKVFDGTELWQAYTLNTSANVYQTRIITDCKIGISTSICSHFVNIVSGWNGSNYGKYSDHSAVTTKYFNLGDNYPTLAEFTTYLAEQYANGTPVTIYYPLATPTYEYITLPSISTFKGTNIINAYDDELQASNIIATYKSSKSS